MILVTGAEGFIGNRLLLKLLEKGEQVYGLDIKDGPMVKPMPVQLIHTMKDPAPKVIFHLAAQSRVQPSFEDPTRTFVDNVQGTQAVLEYARKNGCKVIYAGSSSKHHNPYDSPYAATKMMGEELCKMYRECYGLDVDIARFYNVYGPGEALDLKYGNVIGIWRERVRQGLDIQVVGDGEQKRDFIHVDDIVDGLIKISDAVSPHEDAWELGTGTNYSIIDLATIFHERFGASIDFIPDQKGNYRETLNTNTDAYDRLGWKPTKTVIEYLYSL
jgi:UDP-glucose 4-epimerase